MNDSKKRTGMAIEPEPDAMLDPTMDQALANFRQSVHAWSDAEFSRPRSVRVPVRSAWRPVLAWALGCAVVAAGVSGGVYDHHRNVVAHQQADVRGQASTQARNAEQPAQAEQQKQQQVAKNQPADDEKLLANVDTDVSRSVPAAMEPLAQLMEDDGTNQ